MSNKTPLPTGKHTLVEEGTEFTGKMTSNCPIVVMGKVEGEVAGPSVHVTSSGVIAGTVKVKDLRSEGEVAGDVEAESVRLSGRVRDRTVIRARTLEVALTADKGAMQVQFGDCELAVGDAPDKEAAVAAATAAPAAAGKPEVINDRRKRGPSETWDENATQVATPPVSAAAEPEEHGKRKRGTLPPPA